MMRAEQLGLQIAEHAMDVRRPLVSPQAYPAGPLSGPPVIVLVRENFDRARHQGLVHGSRNTPTSLAFRGSTDIRFIRLDQP